MSAQPTNESLGLVRYDAMVTAIAECHRVDEVKDLRDKARALEVYAKQARNLEAEQRAAEVRVRAERRAGELLNEMAERGERDDGKGNRNPTLKSQGATPKLSDLGITKTQSSRWQALAAVPKQEFEAALKGKKPTTTGLLPKKNNVKPIDPKALWLWGRILDFERDDLFSLDPQELHDEMSPAMQDDMRRLLPLVIDFLTDYSEIVK